MTQTAATTADATLPKELKSLTESDLIFGLAPESFEALSAEDQAQARKDFLDNQEAKVFDVPISVFNGMQSEQQKTIIDDYLESRQRPIAGMPPRRFFELSSEERIKAFELHRAQIENDFKLSKNENRTMSLIAVFLITAAAGSCSYIFGPEKKPDIIPLKPAAISAAPSASR